MGKHETATNDHHDRSIHGEHHGLTPEEILEAERAEKKRQMLHDQLHIHDIEVKEHDSHAQDEPADMYERVARIFKPVWEVVDALGDGITPGPCCGDRKDFPRVRRMSNMKGPVLAAFSVEKAPVEFAKTSKVE